MNITDLTAADIATYGIVALLLPLLTAIINRPNFPAWAKQAIMIGLSIAGGIVAYGAKNAWDFHSANGVITAVIGVGVATQTAYLAFWSRGIGQALESKVNGGKKTAPVVETDDDVVEPADDQSDYDAPIPEGAVAGPADGVPPMQSAKEGK